MVERTKLINVLNEIKCGLTQNEILEQSNAFVFKNKKICSFNGEIFADVEYDIKIKEPFAVVGADLIKILEKVPDEDIDITLEGNELLIKGRQKKAGITIFKEILLPFNEVPAPGKMEKPPAELSHSLLQCARVCGNDHTNSKTTHVHIGSNLVEATDGYRFFRVDLKTRFNKDIMLPADAILSIGERIISGAEFKEGWLHLITIGKTRISIRCSDMDYFEKETLKDLIEVKGSKGQFPKGIKEALDRSRVMQDNMNEVHITLKKGVVKIRTEKDGGWYEERQKIKYNGEDISFTVNIDFLAEILGKTSDVIFGDGKIKIEKENFHFVICIEKK
jgi:DNA polymerase III sliding clamp (beta) subunit (PCNA family)